MLTPVDTVQDALCRFERLTPFGTYSVSSLVPDEFQKYARIFHPAWRLEQGCREALSWAEMARHSGTTPHRLMQWGSISAPAMHGAKVEPPDEGTLPRAVSKPLRDILERHSGNGDCWLGVWPGFGGKCVDGVPVTVTVETRYREWALFRAPLSMMDTSFFAGWDQTANLIWCDDPGWWIHTGIDLNTTYIGGNEHLIRAVLESPELEAWPAMPDDDITMFSDVVNAEDGRDAGSAPRQNVRPEKSHESQVWEGKQGWPNKQSEGTGPTQYFAYAPHTR